MRKTARTVVWEGAGAQSPAPDPIGGADEVQPRSEGQEFRCVHRGGVRLYSARKETMNPHTVLWIYIVLLLVGGLIGFLKAGSKVSLITSAVSAAALVLTAIPNLFVPSLASMIADIIMAALLVVFAIRLGKTKKFMPSGLMLGVTGVALALRHLRIL
jgi:uncharacterized membrane protein (UPF0136 family)